MTTWTNFTGNAGAAVTTWNYHAQTGQLTGKRYHDNQGPDYTYTPAGRLLTRVWQRGVTTTYSHNSAGELSAISYSDGTPGVSFTFDRRGRRVAASNATDVVTYSYHDAGLLLTETHTSGVLSGMVVSASYDALLRRDQLSALNGGTPLSAIGYQYGSASRLRSVSDGTHSATYAYLENAPTLVNSIVFRTGGAPMMTTSKTYDSLNRLTKIESTTGGRPVSSHTYQLNNANQRTKRTDADGTFWDYGYDSLGQVTSAVRKWSDGTPVAGQDYSFAFDDIGNRKTATLNSNVSEYAANLLNQYTQRTVPGLVDIIGAAASNATVTVNGATAGRRGEYFRHELALANTNAAAYSPVSILASMTYNGTNVVVTNTGSAFLPKTPEIFNHDSDGSLTNDGRWAYTWDGENRLLGMETLPNLATYVPVQKLMFQYDCQSRRVSKIVSNFTGGVWSETSNLRFIWDGWNLLAELDKTNAVVRSYAWGLDLSGTEQGAGGIGGLLWANLPQASNTQARGSHFVAFDGNGNVAALLNAQTAQVSAEYEYGPFGETIRATGPAAAENVFRFSAKYTDGESGLINYGYRYYQPSTGRWLSRDPIGEMGGRNLYGFVKNAPQMFIDPLGLAWIPVSTAQGWIMMFVPDSQAYLGGQSSIIPPSTGTAANSVVQSSVLPPGVPDGKASNEKGNSWAYYNVKLQIVVIGSTLEGGFGLYQGDSGSGGGGDQGTVATIPVGVKFLPLRPDSRSGVRCYVENLCTQKCKCPQFSGTNWTVKWRGKDMEGVTVSDVKYVYHTENIGLPTPEYSNATCFVSPDDQKKACRDCDQAAPRKCAQR